MANWSVVEGLTECRVPGKEAAARACGARWVPPASVALLATRKPLSIIGTAISLSGQGVEELS